MKFLMTLLSLVFALVVTTPALAALNNANNPQVLCVPLGSSTSDATLLAGVKSKGLVVTGVSLLNQANLASSSSDYFVLSFKKGSTTVASLDTRLSGQGAITANAKKAFNLVSSEAAVSADAVLSAVYDETDSGSAVALSGAVMCVDFVSK